MSFQAFVNDYDRPQAKYIDTDRKSQSILKSKAQMLMGANVAMTQPKRKGYIFFFDFSVENGELLMLDISIAR